MLERHRDGVPVIPLNFDHAIFERSPASACLFAVFCQGFVVVRGQVQVFDQRHHFTAAAFRGAMYESGLLGRREGETRRGGWLPFAQVAVLGRIHQGIIVDGHTWSLLGSASQDMRADAGCASRRASTSPQSQAPRAAPARPACSAPGGVSGRSHRAWAHPPETAGASTRLAPEGPRATHSLHHTAERDPTRREADGGVGPTATPDNTRATAPGRDPKSASSGRLRADALAHVPPPGWYPPPALAARGYTGEKHRRAAATTRCARRTWRRPRRSHRLVRPETAAVGAPHPR